MKDRTMNLQSSNIDVKDGLHLSKNFRRIAAIALVIFGLGSLQVQAELFSLPGVVPPSACRVGGVLSTEQFTSTGFSNVKTAVPNDQIVAGAWVVANNLIPDMSVVLPPNCGAIALAVDAIPLNLMAVRIKPSISNAAEANIQEIKLVWDVNADTLWDPLVDLVIDTAPGSSLDNQDGVVFFHGPQSPLAHLSNNGGGACTLGSPDAAPGRGGVVVAPGNGTNTRGGNNGCFIALMAIVVIGDTPTTGTQFGLQLEALAGDIPGTTGTANSNISSGFSSSANPHASNIRLQMVGGTPSSHTPMQHISNSSGNPESDISTLSFMGGQSGEGLLTKFRDLQIVPGTREVIAMAVGLCDGGFLASTNASVLPPIAGTPPTIAGGLGSLPCIGSVGTDGFATAINGATLIFRGPLARYMGTVRMYGDLCERANQPALCAHPGGGTFPAGIQISSITDAGGGDGVLFTPGELVQQSVPIYNEETGEAIVQFGGRQGQVLLYPGSPGFAGLFPVAHGSDPICNTPLGAACTTSPGVAGTRPLILIWTVDIDGNAQGGNVDVMLGLQSYDDTAWNGAAVPKTHYCRFFAFGGLGMITAPTIPGVPGTPVPGSCASNFLNTEPEHYSFTVEGPEHPSTPNNLAAFDTNASCFIDDPEFFGMIDGWTNAQIGDSLFFDGVDSWTVQSNVCENVSSSSLSTLSLDSVSLETNFATSSTSFVVEGQSISDISVNVFGLNGENVYSNEAVGSHLTWNQTTTNGAPISNGTYLYVVSANDLNGNQVKSDVGKLVVIR
jgi:hypothetical protein